MPRVFFAPDDGGSGGGSGDDGGDDGGDGGGTGGGSSGGGDDKRFSQEDLDKQLAASMKKWRRQLQKDNAEKDKKIAGLEQSLADLKSELESASDGGDDGADKTVEGRFELLEKKHKREMEELNQKLEAESAARQTAEQKAHTARRDTELTRALEKGGCVDLKAGYRYFLPDVTYDDVEDVFLLEMENGKQVPLNDGVKDLLPDYLKRASSQGGGAGTSGSGSPRTRDQKVAALEQKKKELAELRRNTDGSKRHEMMVYMARKREVEAMERELDSK